MLRGFVEKKNLQNEVDYQKARLESILWVTDDESDKMGCLR